MTSKRERPERTEAQRAQWAEIARGRERARAEAQRARLERERGREEHARAAERARWEECGREGRARAETLRSQWADIARLEERARAAERRARWEERTQAEERAQAEEESARSEHARSSYFLLAIAVRLLPPAERDRYLEEFRAELLDMPRDTQLSHALSVLRGAFVLRLRRGLKKPTDVAVSRANDLPSTRST